MEENENGTENKKLYYTISEVAKMFNVNQSLLRYWEKKFAIIKPKKNKKGNRYFTETDIENIRNIYYLVKERGMTLKGAEKKLRENKNDTANNLEAIQRLKDIRERLVELKSQIS